MYSFAEKCLSYALMKVYWIEQGRHWLLWIRTNYFGILRNSFTKFTNQQTIKVYTMYQWFKFCILLLMYLSKWETSVETYLVLHRKEVIEHKCVCPPPFSGILRCYIKDVCPYRTGTNQRKENYNSQDNQHRGTQP